MSRWVRVAVFIASSLGIATLGLATAAPASAHAALVATDPADGAQLATAPTTVTFTFGEPVSLGAGGYLRVIDQQGDVVSVGKAVHPADSAHTEGDPAKIAATLRPGLGNGTYLASYRVVSEDSHPVAGSSRFVVGDGELVDLKSDVRATDSTLQWMYDAVHGLGFAGLALLGGGWLLITVWPQGRTDRQARGVMWGGWAATAVAACAQLVVQGPYAAGLGIGGVRKANLLNDTLHSVIGVADAMRLLLLAALGVILGRVLDDKRPTKLGMFGAVLFVGIVVTYVLTGHAYAQNPRWLALSSQTLHLIAMSMWLGGLAMLLFAALRSGARPARFVLRRFTFVAYVCVATLVITGSYQAWLGVGTWHALVTTTYGKLVLAKIVALLGMLGFAYFSRRSVSSIPRNKDAASPRRLRQLRGSVVAEAVIGLGVLALTAVLVSEPPGRNAAATVDAQKVTAVRINMAAQGTTKSRTALLTVSPSRAGLVQVKLRLDQGWDLSAMTSAQIGLSAVQLAKQIGPIPIEVKGEAVKGYIGLVTLPVSGKWTFTLRVQTSQFDAVTADTHVTIR